MDEIANLVAQKTGLPADKAQMAVQVVMGYLKEHLPAPAAAQLDNLASGGGAMGGVGDMMKNVGGMFGNK
jgi:hypothetical protein